MCLGSQVLRSALGQCSMHDADALDALDSESPTYYSMR